jgi:Flp pilus assembly protein TadG
MDFCIRTWRGVRAAASALGRRFIRERDGGAALEFAIICLPFFVFLLAVMEIAYMFFLSVMVDNATLAAARKIRTGEMQMASASADDFWEDVCSRIEVVATCDGRLFVDVRTYDSFSNTREPPPVEDGEFDPSNLQTDFGDEGDIVLVRAYYLWDVLFPDLGTGLSNVAGGKRLLSSTVAFRNEPFGEVQVAGGS